MKGLDSIPPTVILDGQFFTVQKSWLKNKFLISNSRVRVFTNSISSNGKITNIKQNIEGVSLYTNHSYLNPHRFVAESYYYDI